MKLSQLCVLGIAVLGIAFSGGLRPLSAEITAPGSSISIRFPAFALEPGQKVEGIRVATSRGRIHNSCLPSRWTCDHEKNAIHCYSMHASYATAMTGKLPELFVSGVPAGGTLSIHAEVEYLSSDGSESVQEFRESDLIVR